MKRQFIHDLYSSFVLWFDHHLLYNGETYSNKNISLYPIKDDKLKAFSVYGSPYKQWNYDSSISGAQVPSGVWSNGNFIPRGQSGLKIDFNNGRVIFSGGVNIPISGQISPKEFNVYTTTQSDQELLFEQRINLASEFPQQPSGIPSDKVVAPGIFIRFDAMTSQPFALGGEYLSKVTARAVILSESNFALDGVGNLFADQKQKNFLIIPKTPLNEFGDLKTGRYSYFEYLNQYFNQRELAYIEDVDFSKAALTPNNPDLKVGFLDFKINLPRFV